MPKFNWTQIWYWASPVIAAVIPAWDYLNQNPLFQSHNVLAVSVIGAKVVHWILSNPKPK